MNIDVTCLSREEVMQFLRQCECLIQACQADVDAYELYIECKNELARRDQLYPTWPVMDFERSIFG